MTQREIRFIRAMIAEGCTDAEVVDAIHQDRREAAEAERFERDAYGYDLDDGMTTGQREFHDRLSYGRNDAGEWLGVHVNPTSSCSASKLFAAGLNFSVYTSPSSG